MHIETCHLSLLVPFHGGRRFKMYPTYKAEWRRVHVEGGIENKNVSLFLEGFRANLDNSFPNPFMQFYSGAIHSFFFFSTFISSSMHQSDQWICIKKELWRSWLIDWSIEVSQPAAEAAVMMHASRLIKRSIKVFILIRSLYYNSLIVSCFIF